MTAAVSAALAARLAGSLQRGRIVLLLTRPGAPGVAAARDRGRAVCAALQSRLQAAHGLSPHVSRSATPGLAAVALSMAGPLGADVERRRARLVDADLLALALHAGERRRWGPLSGAADASGADCFFCIWTRKEAVMKALGLGLALAPTSFDAGPPTADWHRVDTPAGSADVRSLPTADGRFAAALASNAVGGAPSAVDTLWLDDDAAGAPVRHAP